MKKRSTFLTLATSMLVMGNALFAQDSYEYEDYKTTEIYSTDEWIEIDGVDDEACWSASGVTENNIDITLHNWGVQPVENTWGYAATFKAVYDKNYIYIFIKVKDGTYVPYDADLMDGEYNIDNLEIFFFPDPTGRTLAVSEPIDSRSNGLSQIRVSVGNTDNRFTGGGFAVSSASDNKITGYEYATKTTDDGYDVEVVIPWSAIISQAFVGNLEPGGQIMFDINAANCLDYESKNRAIILGWSGDDHHAWKSNSKLGVMTLMGPIVSSTNKIEASEVGYSFTDNLLSLQNVDNAQVDIYDISGRIIESGIYREPINFSAFTSGMYIVNVAGAGSFKIVK